MKITATSIIPGIVDLSASERLYEENPIERDPFRVSIRPGQSITIDDKYYSLESIQRALKLEWITISDYKAQSTFEQEILESESKTTNYGLTKVEIWNRFYYPQDAFRKYNENFELIDEFIGSGSIDGGFANSVYMVEQQIDGGGA